MNKKKILPNIIPVLAVITALTCLMTGVKKHETWQIVLNSITLGLLVILFVLNAVKAARQKT